MTTHDYLHDIVDREHHERLLTGVFLACLAVAVIVIGLSFAAA